MWNAVQLTFYFSMAIPRYWHSRKMPHMQGCQMVLFQTKNPNLGNFWRFLQWKMLVYFMVTWSILQYLLYFMDNWYSSW
jgi:hypothetical protein